MKKISLLAVASITAFIVHAQTLGLKGGLNLATLDNSQSADFNSRLSYHAGLLINVPVGDQIAVQPEVIYSSQGAKYTLAGLEHDLAINYINIPIMLQAKVGKGFYAEVGPQLGLLTGVKDKANDIETGFFTTDDFKKSDVSLGIGLGYRGTSGLGLNARYNLGVTDINKVGSNNLKNNVLQIGLSFNLSGRGF
jgi:hypothetical protein